MSAEPSMALEVTIVAKLIDADNLSRPGIGTDLLPA
jgi:hypothetical protein